MKTDSSSRRSWLTRMAALVGSVLVFRQSHAGAIKTPKTTEGPFYPKPSMRLSDVDNDLVKVEGVVAQAGGEIVTLKGVVSDRDGNVLRGLRVEIWQCDVNGKYLHTGDKQSVAFDNAFQGFGHDITNEKGEYSFRTIKPAKYPGRTEHIHVKVCTEDKELLTSQFYIDGEPNNDQDWLYRKMSAEEAASVAMKFVPTDVHPQAVVNIVV